ncbi:protein of unknown function [Paraburkholderia kururiensis]
MRDDHEAHNTPHTHGKLGRTSPAA